MGHYSNLYEQEYEKCNSNSEKKKGDSNNQGRVIQPEDFEHLAKKIQEHLTSVGVEGVEPERTDITKLLVQVLELDGIKRELIKRRK